MPGDDLGFVFVDLRSIMDAALAMTEELASAPPMSDALTALVPEWASFRLRVEGDALVMDSAMPHVEAAPGPGENHANGVAAYAPPSTLVLAAGNDLGATLNETSPSTAATRPSPRHSRASTRPQACSAAWRPASAGWATRDS